MLRALLYLQYHSARNRALTRLKRLKQPKYLVGGLVGLAYFYWYFGRFLFGLPGRSPGLPTATPVPTQYPVLYESLGALFLLVAFLLAWLLPHERAVLAFSEAEVAFLFPAPISRRGLIHFKLARSQVRILFTSLLLMLVTHRLGGRLWTHALGWWVLLSTLSLHWLGSSFTRTLLLDRGIRNWQRRLGVLALVLVAAGAIIVWARRTLPLPDFSSFNGPQSVADYGEQLLASGPLLYLLYPFRLLVRPYLAPNALAFLAALGPALVLLLLLYTWVIRANVAFEEASADAAGKMAARLAALRAGNFRTHDRRPRVRRSPFALRPTGPPLVALLWKNIISAGQLFTLRLWFLFVILGVCMAMVVSQVAAHSGVAPVLGMITALLLAWSLLLGPQLLRQDFRQDLPLGDLLKTYPLPGWQIALGEVLAPVLILTAIQWFLLAVAAVLCLQLPDARPHAPLLLASALGAAFLFPALNLILLLIPNAAVLLFPAWFQAAKEGPRGIEATGQRIIFALGQFLVLALSLLPAAAVAALLFFGLQLFAPLPLVIPLAAAAATLVLAAEAALGLLLLGRLFDRFDLSELAA